ncbi:MAG: flippase-like domain-containing protein [Chloroflexota bacterium]|nr:flippase-like domain-containing protein [Chloroflexota bacterium]
MTRTRAVVSTVRRYLHLAVGTLLTFVAVYFLYQEVDVREVWAILWQANGWFIGFAVISMGIQTVSKTIRWQVLLGKARHSVTFSQVLSVLLIGQMLNTFIPMRVGDLARVHLLGIQGPGRSHTLGTIVLEKSVDMLCYALLFFCSPFWCRFRFG